MGEGAQSFPTSFLIHALQKQRDDLCNARIRQAGQVAHLGFRDRVPLFLPAIGFPRYAADDLPDSRRYHKHEPHARICEELDRLLREPADYAPTLAERHCSLGEGPEIGDYGIRNRNTDLSPPATPKPSPMASTLNPKKIKNQPKWVRRFHPCRIVSVMAIF